MKHAVLPPFAQPPKRELIAKGHRQQRTQKELNLKIVFQDNINEEADNATWQQLLKILGLENSTYYNQ